MLMAQNSQPVVQISGSLSIDHMQVDGQNYLALGGTTFYSGTALAISEVPVLIHCSLPEGYRDRVSNRMQHPNIHFRFQDSKDLTQFVNLEIGPEQRQQSVLSRSSPLSLELFEAIEWLHLGPLFDKDLDGAAFSPSAAIKVSMDAQGFCRQIKAQKVEAGFHEAPVDLHQIDVLKASLEEWQIIQKHYTWEPAYFAQHFALDLLISAGHRGGRWISADGKESKWEATHVDHIQSETGAGDVFMAGCIAGMIQVGEMESAVIRGAEWAAKHVSGNLMGDFGQLPASWLSEPRD
jgi:sugar/nucleoside kinase (ribokinase family)